MNYNDGDENRYNYIPDEEPLHRSRSKKTTSARIEKRLKKKANKEKRNNFFKSLGIVASVVLIILIIVGTGVGIGMYTAVSTEINDMNISDLALNNESFIMYTDSAGDEHEFEKIKSTVNRKWISSEEIGDNLKKAAVAIEDQRFMKHHGVDIKRTVGATAKYALSKIGIGDSSYGGSTITQQVIKNITKEEERSAVRKVKEMMRAIALEKQLSKDDILTMYLNIVYFANNCWGVEAASNMYFGKSANELTLEEAASVVGITQTPAKYDPYAHPDNNIEKRNRVLGKMLELEMISQEEYDKASTSALKVVEKKKQSGNDITSYFADQVMNDVISDMQNIKGYSADFAQQQLTNGGIKIYATVDLDIQNEMEKVFENKSNFPNSSAQSAMIIMDPYNGEIKGIVGGIGKKTEIRGLNRATQSRLQPGSALKPLAVYAPAIELEQIDETTIVTDEKITIGNDNWEPKNAYSGFKGDMTVKEAVGRSSNIPAVKVLDMIGINKSYSYIENNFKISTLTSADKNYSSLALGGLTKGVSVKEMAAAYSIFANGGKYNKPITYTKVVDASGNTILENQHSATQSLKASTAYIMTDLLKEPVNSSYGTARRAKLSNVTTFGKTGTTNDNKDKWFVGFTPYYVGAVWYGFDQPKSVGSSNPTVSAWKTVMQNVHKNLEDKEFQIPSTVEETEVCSITGLLPRSSCDTEEAYYANGRAPKKTCSGHSKKKKTSSSTEKPSKSTTEKPDSKETTEPKKTATPEKTNPTVAPIETETVQETTPVKSDTSNNEAVPERTDEE